MRNGRWRFAVVLFALAACSAEPNVWSIIKTSSPEPASAIGSYANGCLAGAQSLPPDGPGYQVMRLSRSRFYGHPELIAYLKKLGSQMSRNHGVILIGDMAQPRGGAMPSGHASHQTGLEADIWYTHPKSAETMSLTLKEREELAAPSLVTTDGSRVDPTRWNTQDATLLRTAARDPNVDRIFVNPAIKRELCRVAPGSAWLHKIRPWWGHDEHFHVRLQCPAGDRDCIAQPANIPAGDGCDATLDWWFTDEARAAEHQPHNVDISTQPLAELPDRCKTLATLP